jgi:hypothetical protein
VGPFFDHDVVAFPLPGITGPQVGQSEITFDRMVNPTSFALATDVSVDLTSTGATSLFTASRKTYILGVILRSDAANTVTSPPQISVGINPITDNVFENESMVNFDTVDDVYTFWSNLNTAFVMNVSDQLDINVNTAATATTLTAIAYVVGIIA